MKPYTTWTLFEAHPGHRRNGEYHPFRWTGCKRDRIPSYWRDTLRDLAECTGGP